MNRALLLSGALGELAKAGKPIVMIAVSSELVRQAMADVHEQDVDDPSSFHCPGCDVRFEMFVRGDETHDVAQLGPIALFLHMLECRQYHQIVEPSTIEPF